MALHLLLVIGLALLLVGILDLFERWYSFYLHKFRIDPKLIQLLQRLKWIILAFIFWNAMVSRKLIIKIDYSHFLFALFIFCLFRLLSSVYNNGHTNKEHN